MKGLLDHSGIVGENPGLRKERSSQEHYVEEAATILQWIVE
jgi:hypothetical protein